jgi:hypothetical protein
MLRQNLWAKSLTAVLLTRVETTRVKRGVAAGALTAPAGSW